jgi:hypothetical protein
MVQKEKTTKAVTSSAVHPKSHALSQRSFPHHQKSRLKKLTCLTYVPQNRNVRAREFEVRVTMVLFGPEPKQEIGSAKYLL